MAIFKFGVAPHPSASRPPPLSTLHDVRSAIKLDNYLWTGPSPINRNREALLRVIAAMYALAGLAHGAKFSTLPRFAYRAILRILRPAEAAVRRLIVLAAFDLKPAVNNDTLNATNTKAIAVPQWQSFNKQTARFATFPLIDPLKHFANQDFATQDFMGQDFFGQYFTTERDEPHDPSIPRISLPGFLDPVFIVPSQPSAQDIISAAHLNIRLAALTRALSNLNNQARRLALWNARRDLELAQKSAFKPRRISPLRPGSPPGARQHRVHEVDHILRECHLLALDRMADTT